jgi:hypothetical protein
MKLENEGKVVEQASKLNFVGYLIQNDDNDINVKLQRCNKMNGIIKGHFGEQMTTETKLQIYNITSKAAFFYGCGNWITRIN